MNYPKISIVTPSYNQGQYLEETILSVLNQNYPNLEYIIVDGGSTDNSVEIIKKYENKLAYWVSEKDNGMYHALQKGFEKTTGELMAWINSDDMYHRKSFFTVADIFSKFNEVNWLVGNPTGFDELGRTVIVPPITLWSKYNHYSIDHKCIQQESTFWRRNLWEKAGSKINDNLKFAGDFELWHRFFKYEKLYATDALIGGFRGRSCNQLSLDHWPEYLKEANSCLKNDLLDQQTKKKISKIKFYEMLVRIAHKINTEWFKMEYFNLFEYPPKLTFSRERQTFELCEKHSKQSVIWQVNTDLTLI